MTCFTFRTSMANCSTDRQFRSVCTTTLATLRCTNSSPGSRPTISLAGTRLSEQPIHRYSGACWRSSRLKKSVSAAILRAAHARLLAFKWSSILAPPAALISSPPFGRDAEPFEIDERGSLQQLLGGHGQGAPCRIAARKQTGNAVRQRPDVQGHHHGGRAFAHRHSSNDRLTGAPQHGKGAIAGLLQVAVLGNGQPRFEHGGEVGGLVTREGQIGTPHALERRKRARAAFIPGGRQSLLELLKAAARNIRHQRIAVAEVAVGRRRADTSLAGRLRKGDTRRALLGNEVQRRADQRLAQIAVMIAAPPAAACPTHESKS